MTTQAPDSRAVAALQVQIADFLAARLADKLDKLKVDEAQPEAAAAAKAALVESFLPPQWLADAAHRASQLQEITHASKYIHPDNKASSCYSHGNPESGPARLGTHILGDALTPDVVGNAAALDVYTFLRINHEGQTLLDLASQQSPDLAAALANWGSAAQAADWMRAFASLRQPDPQPAAHTLAKQVYWPLAAGGYHLLAPLYPTVLVHAIHGRIKADRFSDQAKAARAARRARQPHPHGYSDYPGLALSRFGGTKPQNISQLNSERSGEAYLLPALPPVWRSSSTRPPLRVKSVFAGTVSPFARRPLVRETLRLWKDFLARLAGNSISTLAIRQHRERLLGQLVDELIQYAAEIHTLPPGWSQSTDCQLPAEELCWLDPHCPEARPVSDWQQQVALRFGNWLNARLESKNVVLGEAEAEHWQRALHRELNLLQQEVANHD